MCVGKHAAQRTREEVAHGQPRISRRAQDHPKIDQVVEHQPRHIARAGDVQVDGSVGPGGTEGGDGLRGEAVGQGGRHRDAEHPGPAGAQVAGQALHDLDCGEGADRPGEQGLGFGRRDQTFPLPSEELEAEPVLGLLQRFAHRRLRDPE